MQRIVVVVERVRRADAVPSRVLALICANNASHAQAQCEDLFGDGFGTAAAAAPVSGSSTIQTTHGATHTCH
jgi:hypothetical protein